MNLRSLSGKCALILSLATQAQTNYDTVRIHPVKITGLIYMLKKHQALRATWCLCAFVVKKKIIISFLKFLPLAPAATGQCLRHPPDYSSA
jgi:hypothetical protein